MCAFVDTINKKTIRRCWDRPILERWRDQTGRSLTYFGLPGPEVQDLLDWRDMLGIRTGVESPRGRTADEKERAVETIGRLNMNVLAHGISSGFQLLRSDIEDVIINALDDDGNSLILNDGRAAHLSRFTYDLVNLDFDGGLGYRNKQGKVKRVTAIKKLFERQEGHSFIFLLTVNVRHNLGSEIEDYLHGLRSRDRGASWHNVLDWYLTRGNGQLEYKLKATIPSFIHAISELHMFRSTCHPPIVYEGYEQARMMHFAFELISGTHNLREFSSQDDIDLINLPLLRCEHGILKITKIQHPGYEWNQCSSCLEFLPRGTKEAILQAAEEK